MKLNNDGVQEAKKMAGGADAPPAILLPLFDTFRNPPDALKIEVLTFQSFMEQTAYAELVALETAD